jgi:hypothetical protein
MNSKLLKEAIADAKAVRETALANAKIALEEAFTPKLQSMLSKKLQEELEGDESDKEEDAAELTQENDVSSEIGGGDGTKMPAAKAFSSAAESDELGAADVDKQTAAVGSEDENAEKVAGITEGEEEEDVTGATPETGMNEEEEMDDVDSEIDEIIKELEAAADGEDEGSTEDAVEDAAEYTEGEEAEAPVATEAPAAEDEIDLDEILREMGYGDEPTEEAPVATEGEESEEEMNALKAELKSVQSELGEAISVIKSLKGTINEVNLLNAKLLYVNKLFRSFNLTNEQKSKVVETLDRTKNVREVKLVFSTIAESFKFGNGVAKKTTAKLTESYASKPAASTAPKQIIAEDNSASDRFKKLAGIIK